MLGEAWVAESMHFYVVPALYPHTWGTICMHFYMVFGGMRIPWWHFVCIFTWYSLVCAYLGGTLYRFLRDLRIPGEHLRDIRIPGVAESM